MIGRSCSAVWSRRAKSVRFRSWQLEQIVDNVEQRVFTALESEVSSKTIGELVMEQLRSVDEVAYVRFASVYRQFKDINTFMDELNTLLKDK